MTSRLDLLNSVMGNRVVADAARSRRAAGTTSMPSALSILIDRVEPDADQPRKVFDQQEIDNLAASISSVGLLQPITVRYVADRDRYVIVDGERRWRASKAAGKASIQCVVNDQDLTPDRIMQLQLVANALRCDLSPMEAARAYRSLQTVWGCTAKELAARLNVSESKLSRTLALLDLSDKERQAIESGAVAPTAAVKRARTKPTTARKRAARPVTIRTPLGVVTLKPARQDVSLVDLLQAAIASLPQRGAA
jgi:ParB family chromosome partitioning protein